MSNAHKGSRLILKDQVIAVPFNSAHLDYNVDSSGIYYGNIILPTNNSVYTMRPYEGRFGGGVAIEEGTVNLVDNPYFKDGISGWSNGSWDIMNYNDINNFISMDTGVLHLLQTGNTNCFARYYSQLPYNSGDTISSSMYFELVSGDPNDISIGGVGFYSGGGYTDYTWVNTNATLTNLYDNIYRIEQPNITFDTSRTGTVYEPRISGIHSNPIEINVLSMQIEKKQFCTSFVNGTRFGGTLQYPVKLNNPPFSLSCWVKTHGSAEYIYDTRTSDYEGHLLYNYGKKINFLTSPDGGSWNNLTSTTDVYDGNWHHVVITLDQGLTKRLYVDGKLEGNSTVTSIRYGSDIYIGSRYTSTNQLDGIISDLVITKDIMRDEDIKSIYISSKPSYNPYDYRSFTY